MHQRLNPAPLKERTCHCQPGGPAKASRSGDQTAGRRVATKPAHPGKTPSEAITASQTGT
uniref:Uncharacterized protein n=1 Tax=Loigolactobacillus rennini TaxID=238013 RepID=A0A1K2I9U2_9LACO|nr:hypothetical protein LREN565_2183 [Loigolactobacillus rennini]